jgi:solute carrier family 6 noradrenalin transporter-like protein 2
VILGEIKTSSLIFRGSSLPGSFQGMEFLMKPNLTKIQEGWKPWETACVHSVFSTAAGNGVHLTFASYNKFDRPILRWAFTAVCVDFLVSVISTLLGKYW